jgi:hypothetical protein
MRDQGAGLRVGQAELQGVGAEQREQRHRDSAELVDGKMGNGGLRDVVGVAVFCCLFRAPFLVRL